MKKNSKISILSQHIAMDRYVMWAVLVLCTVGVVAVYSAIGYLATTKAGGNTEGILLKHILRVGIALMALGIFSQINYRFVAKFSKILLLVSIILLVMVQIAGDLRGGAFRSIFGIQPSDLARIALVMHVAVLIAKKQTYIQDFWRGAVPILGWVALVIVLIGMQDVSTAMVVLLIVGIMMIVGRMKISHLALLSLMGAILFMVMLSIYPERASRVESWLGIKLFPHTTEQEVLSRHDGGFQADQAQIAIAMGGLTGVGAGKSIQRDFIPEAYNDFIFAIITEEYGMIGGLFLLLMFLILLFRGFLRIARYAPDPLGFFVALGITSTICLYGFINICVVVGIVPVTGLPMPFVSYGGTSLVVMGAMMGTLLNISGHIKANVAVEKK